MNILLTIVFWFIVLYVLPVLILILYYRHRYIKNNTKKQLLEIDIRYALIPVANIFMVFGESMGILAKLNLYDTLSNPLRKYIMDWITKPKK